MKASLFGPLARRVVDHHAYKIKWLVLTEHVESAISPTVHPIAVQNTYTPPLGGMSSSIPLITDLSWKTERLVYRAIDKQKDGEFLERLHDIPLVRSIFDSNLTAPTGKGYTDGKLRNSDQEMVQ